MNITTKIIITDTNIITDLNNAKILDKFINLDNVFISDMIKNDEINSKTGNVALISKFKVISATPMQLIEISKLSRIEKNFQNALYVKIVQMLQNVIFSIFLHVQKQY